ncbi:MAG: PepSY domain-containing protein [Oscillatoriales cyanobacterium C42_A2020_001]|nr:PepSY domain-containing protein [Leptolyngbyaceae cyanobacterium C42_A2020_001]
MNTKKLRDVLFPLHRYVGLAIGLLLIIVGLTGSLLVFQHEITDFLVEQQFGKVVPEGQPVAIATILDTVKAKFADQPDLKLLGINTLPDSHAPYRALLKAPDDQLTEAFVNPYTGAIMGDRIWNHTLIGFTFSLHYQLLAGEVGQIIVGIAALMLLILSLTGIALWSGWRKLISGFKIKWNAHPKRTNYDVHKVAGIVTAVFLSMIAFTGFCWNFYEQTKPLIHAATLTPVPPPPVSTPIAGKTPLPLTDILQKADAALPGAATTFIRVPQNPEGAFLIGKKQPQENSDHYGDSRIYLDQYTGNVVQLTNGLELSRADKVLNAFVPLHYGTFWGLPSRIFYIFVGLSPLILFVTGFVMWWYRKRKKKSDRAEQPILVQSR